eukprot:g2617.t1
MKSSSGTGADSTQQRWQQECNGSRLLASGEAVTIAHGAVLQQVKAPTTGGSALDHLARQIPFYILEGIVRPTEVREMLDILQSPSVPYDMDPDTVDGMSTFEIFLQKMDGEWGQTGVGDQRDEPARKRLREITEKILEERITPMVRQRYPKECSSALGRRCTPCYSLIRKYTPAQRMSHAPHHDGHAIVTVVVSLSDFGVDYGGGLYVTSARRNKLFLALRKGDAVMHKSELLHGVKVLPVENDSGDQTRRWSWILWYRDSDTCEDHGHEWFKTCAEQGDPTCQFLYATKVGNRGNTEEIDPERYRNELMDKVLLWNSRAAEGGSGAAAVKIARAYLKALPSHLDYSEEDAERMFRMAIDNAQEPDAYYGLAQLFLQRSTALRKEGSGKSEAHANANLRDAVRMLEEAALRGHTYAMFNLGIAHLYGYGMAQRNPATAAEWFEACGMPEGMVAKGLYLRSQGQTTQAQAIEARAKTLGWGTQWYVQARKTTGSGGAAGVPLNLDWPITRDGVRPPEW